MKIVKMKIALAVMIALGLGTGCVTDYSFDARATALASDLSGNTRDYDTNIHTVAVTTFVGLGPLKGGSYFGRQVSERLAHALQTKGYRVFELRKGKDVNVVENSGEFLLTRKPGELVSPYKADAVLVGTYQKLGSVVTVHARLLDVETSRVISVATADFSDKDDYTAALLNEEDLREKDEEAAFEAAITQLALEIHDLKADNSDGTKDLKSEKADVVHRMLGIREGKADKTDGAPKMLRIREGKAEKTDSSPKMLRIREGKAEKTEGMRELKAEKTDIAAKMQGAIRELMAEETDTVSKTLALKIDRLIRDITRTITPGKLGQPVAVASFVDLDKLNSTNTFGRFLTEGVMDRMSSRGYTIVETRTARELMTQPNVGEQALSREPEEMKGGAAADFVVLGTYTMSGDTLSVHARLVKPESRQVVAKGMFQMNVRPGDPFMKRMFEEPFERVGENNYSEGSRKK